MSSDNSLITFKAISNFTTCLGEVFGQDHRALKLYAHLINKTTISHEKPIQKHIEAFRDFCIKNREAIFEKKNNMFVGDSKITYSNRVYIDMNAIFKEADMETQTVIWKHLLTISALTDPAGKARQILKDSKDNVHEADFLTDIIGKVEKHVDPNANPMDAVNSIMQSGIFNDLVGGMGNGLQDGSLDLGKLMGTVQTMVSSLNEQNGGDDETTKMVNSMMGNLQGVVESAEKGEDTPPPDIMGMLGPMMSSLAVQPPTGNGSGIVSGGSIEEKIQAQVDDAKKSGKLKLKNQPAIEEIE